MKREWKRCIAAFAGASFLFVVIASAKSVYGPLWFRDASGLFQVTTTNPAGLDASSPFFQSLGTNGRSCASCHAPADGFSITPVHLQQRFVQSAGTDPVFRPVDGTVCPTADVSTYQAKREAYRLLLDRGLIRVSMAIPANAHFYLESVEDPYNCATSENISLYRRPLPATNLRFLSAVMWDGREPSLASQATDAITGHAQGELPSEDIVNEIVNFESSLYTAQAVDIKSGALTSDGAHGGSAALSQQAFYAGINDSLGNDPSHATFNPSVFTIFSAWNNSADPWRASVARGEEIFNHRPIAITGVKGLNDMLNAKVINGTCSTCHDAPNAGTHSLPVALNIGTASFDPDGTQLSYLPKYHFRCDDGQEVVTTDPGRGLITGKCADLGKFKGPVLRALAERPPYFHNGRARTLGDVVDFYNQRFTMNLAPQERSDLVAFLSSL